MGGKGQGLDGDSGMLCVVVLASWNVLCLAGLPVLQARATEPLLSGIQSKVAPSLTSLCRVSDVTVSARVLVRVCISP